jgi:vancomycin permeability regulator SanA
VTAASAGAAAVPSAPGTARRPSGRRRGLALPVALLAGLTAAALPAAAVLAGSVAWVRHSAAGRVYGVTDVPKAPVALVFGAAVTPAGQPTPFLAYRLQVARTLYESGRVRVVLVSGDNGETTYDEPGVMRSWLIDHGVPAARVVVDDAGFDTYASCYRARHVFGVQEAILVSQSYHVPRALAICRSLGVRADAVGTDQDSGSAAWRSGARRELAADVKAALDVTVHARPRFPGPPDDAVRLALAAKGERA